jgi:hypothetical protein
MICVTGTEVLNYSYFDVSSAHRRAKVFVSCVGFVLSNLLSEFIEERLRIVAARRKFNLQTAIVSLKKNRLVVYIMYLEYERDMQLHSMKVKSIASAEYDTNS